MPPTEAPILPKPSVPQSVLEKLTGCTVVTYMVEDGSKPGDNYMSILYSVSATVIPPGGSDSDKEVRHYLFKCYPRHPARQMYLSKTNVFHNELSFYKIWSKELVNFQTNVVGNAEEKLIKPAFPPCIGGVAVDFVNSKSEALTKVYEPLDNFIMMVDLRKTWDFRMADRKTGLDYNHIQLAFSELAKIHALSWAYRNKVEYDLIKKFPFLQMPFAKEDMEMWSKVLEGNVNTAISTFDKICGKDNLLSKSTKEFVSKGMTIINYFIDQNEDAESLFWELHRDPPKDLVEASVNEEPWRIICHGDSWCNNMLFQYNEETGKPEKIMLVDFQLTREACPTADLVYIIYTSTTAEFRKKYLDEMLQLYHDKFVEVCKTLKVETLPGFSVESLKRKFYRSKPLGYMMALIGLPLMLLEATEGINLDKIDENVEIEDMMIEAFGKGAGGILYEERITAVAQELYDEGVI